MSTPNTIRADQVQVGDTIEPAPGWAAWDGPNTVQEVVDLRSLILLMYPNGRASTHDRDFPFIRKASK